MSLQFPAHINTDSLQFPDHTKLISLQFPAHTTHIYAAHNHHFNKMYITVIYIMYTVIIKRSQSTSVDY